VAFDDGNTLPKLGGVFADGFSLAYANGSAMFVLKTIDATTLRALITRSGAEPVSADKIPMLPAR
jgi:hypothetical protein